MAPSELRTVGTVDVTCISVVGRLAVWEGEGVVSARIGRCLVPPVERWCRGAWSGSLAAVVGIGMRSRGLCALTMLRGRVAGPCGLLLGAFCTPVPNLACCFGPFVVLGALVGVMERLVCRLDLKEKVSQQGGRDRGMNLGQLRNSKQQLTFLNSAVSVECMFLSGWCCLASFM